LVEVQAAQAINSNRDASVSLVSVIVPCYNEQATIRLLLNSLYTQTYPRHAMEVIIADGLSTDQTRQEIAAFQLEHEDLRVRVVENPQRIIPAGLNRAIQAAEGEYIVRLDGHSIPDADYVARCVKALSHEKGDTVGGIWVIRPRGSGWQARAIAAAAAHPLGVGDARYRLGGQSQYVDTVPFGAFHHTLIERVGSFDESLLTNEDYEFNTRVRKLGGKIWLDPKIRSVYFPPGTLAGLARQYWRYGFWKVRMLRRYPESIRWRQLLPPAFVLALLLSGVLSIWHPLGRLALGFGLVSYTFVLLAAGLLAAIQKRDPAHVIGLPLAIATMHFAWGTAFLWSLLKRRP
jgi:succinoglycan biosynthesis protein ExoA